MLVPAGVAFDQERERYVEEQEGWAKQFSRELQGLDQRLSLVWIRDDAPEYGGLVPGRWHVRRRNENGPDSYLPITGIHGEYMEPHSGVLEQLRQNDLWRGDVSKTLWERRRRDAETKVKAREAAREERTEELRMRVKASTNPGVLFGGNGWTYRAGAKRA